jgi:hypothetical protein
MAPNGVAIFYRDRFRGEDRPVQFAWGTDPRSIEEAWNSALENLSARDADELRREGYFAALVCLEPLVEEDLEPRGFIDSCLRQVEIEVIPSECTSQAGNELVTETWLDVRLATDRVRVPLASHRPALPEFAADYLDCRDEGDVELPLYFVLQERTATHAIYSVQEWEKSHTAKRGQMAPSNRHLQGQFQKSRRQA